MTTKRRKPASPEELAAARHVRHIVPALWMEDHCTIEPKEGGRCQLIPNVAQQIVLSAIAMQRRRQRPVKLIILKARQRGISTLGLGYMYYRVNRKSSHHALMAAHKIEAAEGLFDKIRLFQSNNPEARVAQYSTRRELMFEEPHRSRLWVATAGRDDLGRSGTIQDAHLSELAIWQNAKASLSAVMACIPKENDNWDTTVIIESTPKGWGGEFCERWCRATPMPGLEWMTLPKGDGEDSDFIAIYLPWHTDPAYRAKVRGKFERTTEEEEIAARYGLDNEQLQWRRTTIADDCGGDIDLFRQENSSNDVESFLLSGRPVFNQVRIRAMMSKVRDPIDIGNIYRARNGEISLTDEPLGHLQIWEMPQQDAQYAIGADTAEGLQPDEAQKPDAHSAPILKLPERGSNIVRMVALLSGRYDPDMYANDLALLDLWYNYALLGFEINNTSGGAVRSVLRRQEEVLNLFYRETYDEDADKITKKLGWSTDKMTRGQMISDLGSAVRTGILLVPSLAVCQQLQTFVYDKTGKAAAEPGGYDDHVFGLGVAYQMALTSIETGRTALPDQTGEKVGSHEDGEPFDTSMIVGGREPEELEDEYGDEWDEEE